MDRRKFLLENLARYDTLPELQRSSFFRDAGGEIERILTTPEVSHCSSAVPRLRSFLRVGQWNIEKGKKFHDIIRMIDSSKTLRWSDVLLVNEADSGMNRSGNRHVALAMAEALRMNMAFCPAHIELTKGTEDDLALPGENEESLQGNAVLSRYPILDARVVRLPSCFEHYEFYEKRYGSRNCVWVQIQLPGGRIWVGSVHLEVRNTPECRGTQMDYLLSHLPGDGAERYLLGGDMNCHTFRRGTRWRTLQSVWRLLSTPPDVVSEELLYPDRLDREPLFRIARAAGFEWDGLNSRLASSSAPIEGLEDSRLFPGPALRFIRSRLEPFGGSLNFKLDWLLAKGVRAVREGEILDDDARIGSQAPGCVTTQIAGSDRLSDHRPIYADVWI